MPRPEGMTHMTPTATLLAWPRRRRLAVLALTPVLAGAFLAVSGTPVADGSAAWLLLVAVAAALGAAVLASYLPRTGLRPQLGCTPCAAMSAMTVVGAAVALNTYGSALIGPALAVAATLFGLAQRL